MTQQLYAWQTTPISGFGEDVSGTVGHTNFVFYKGRLYDLGCKVDVLVKPLTEPGYYGVCTLDAEMAATCGFVYCHVEAISAATMMRKMWRGLGVHVTNGDEGKAVTLTVVGPARVKHTARDGVVGVHSLLRVGYRKTRRSHVDRQKPGLNVDGVVVGITTVNETDDGYWAQYFPLGRVLDGGRDTLLVLLAKPTIVWQHLCASGGDGDEGAGGEEF